MNPTTDSIPEPSLLTQAKERPHAFFRQPVIKKSVDILVPGILAAVLFPVFGPSVAARRRPLPSKMVSRYLASR